MKIIFQYIDKKNKKKTMLYLKRKKRIIYTNYNNWIFMHRFAKEIFFH